MCKVSVIVPIYNVEEYLEDCLRSMERQTLEDIEVIMVDDGSTDRSGDIARNYAEKNSRFRYFLKKNGGLGSARNKGLDVAIGKYVYFVDSDDYISDDALLKLYDTMEERKLDVVLFNCREFTDANNIEESKTVYNERWYGKTMSGKDLLSLESERGKYEPSNCVLMSRRDYVVSQGVRYEEGILHEDIPFFLALMSSAERVMVVKDSFYYRRIRPNSIMTGDKYKERFSSSVYVADIISALDSSKQLFSFFIKITLGTAINEYTKGRLYNDRSIDLRESYKAFRVIAYKYRWWRSLYFLLFCTCDKIAMLYKESDQ